MDDADTVDETPADAAGADVSLNELVNYLTPRRENEAMAMYQNTTSIACPVCDEPFDYLVVCKQDQTSLSLSNVMDICVTTDDNGRTLLFTHE